VSQEVRISGLASTHYVKEIRYNGIPIRDDVVPIEKSAAMQSLAIVLDDRPATITGSAVDGDRPVGQAYVMLQKWPPASDRTGSITSTCTADERGSFQFTGLVPGRYRIISIRSSAENLRRGPGVLERAMVGASQVDVGRGENQQITVEVRSLVAKTSDRSALPAVSWRPLLVPLPAALIGFFRNPA
jgi:hypothetical protein